MRIQTMAARARGEALAPWSYDPGPLGPHDCLLEVLACGICHSDVHMIDDDWGLAAFPLVPGHEIVARVVETGPHATRLRPGDRVGVGWQNRSCLQCRECLRGDENLCLESQGVIVGRHGGFAGHLVADSRFCFPLPAGIPDEAAGPLLCGGITVYSALRHAGMSSGQEIGVLGVGGLGHLAVQFAARLGNRVTVFTGSPDKAEAAAALGAQAAILVRDGRPAAAPARPLQILISTVPAHPEWDSFLDLLDADGVLALVGAAMDRPLRIGLDRLLFRRRRVMASPIGGRAMMGEMLDAADRFGVRPLTEVFPLGRVNEALARVRENRVRYRAVLLP